MDTRLLETKFSYWRLNNRNESLKDEVALLPITQRPLVACYCRNSGCQPSTLLTESFNCFPSPTSISSNAMCTTETLLQEADCCCCCSKTSLEETKTREDEPRVPGRRPKFSSGALDSLLWHLVTSLNANEGIHISVTHPRWKSSLSRSMLCFSGASQGRCCCCCCRRRRALLGTFLYSNPGQAPQCCRNAPVFPGGDIHRNVNKSGATSLKSAVPGEETRDCLLQKPGSRSHLVCRLRHRQQMWRRGEIEHPKAGMKATRG